MKRMIITLVALAASSAAFATPPTKSELLFQWESNWTTVNDLELTFQRIRNGKPSSSVMIRWSGSRVLARETRSVEAGEAVDETSFDSAATPGGRRMSLSPSQHRPFGWLTAKNPVIPMADWLCRMLRPPGDVQASWAPHLSLSRILSDPRSVVRPQLEAVDGRATAVVDLYGDPAQGAGDVVIFSAWLDIERSAVPLKWEMSRAGAGTWMTQRLLDYVELEGAWLPTRLEAVWGEKSALPGEQQKWQVTTTKGAPDIRVNSGLSPEQCEVRFPPGCHVIDLDTEDSYVVTAGNQLSDLRAVYAAAGRIAPARSPASRRTAIGVVALVALGGGAGLRLMLWR